MSSFEKIIDRKTQIAFNKKVLSASQQLHPYVKHRLYIAESTGVLPKNMFTSNGIIDESIATFYENGYDIDCGIHAIKLKLFKIVDKDLDTLFKKEAFHKNTISTNSILEEELDGLDEQYTIDDDWDFIMGEELNDISYHQPDKHNHIFLYDDNNSSILNAFDMEHVSANNSQKALGSLYTWLPLNVSNIVDLYIFGKLSFEDISKVKNIESSRVELIFDEIIKKFKNHIE
ncbi:hypothetical protein [Confluentibacter flavum]|uniref:Uncharacterized protein n=1 Tax=Confluentibacter flavum TaxID=1909700 RepID=A0A2N3HMX7_9FLAO|nr:hypothetical protein [Confluentibacter flavum]PKQ46287.1 hypothetical protein CSW08_03755 [Confluentibacter flavum]